MDSNAAFLAMAQTAFLQAPLEEPTAVTLSSPVLTFVPGNPNAATLVVTLSASVGTVPSFTPIGMSLYAASRRWSFDLATGSLSGTTLTIAGLIGEIADTNYSSGDDLYAYAGTDSLHLPSVAELTATAVAFPSPLAVPDGNPQYDDPTNLIGVPMTKTLGTWEVTPGNYSAWFNNHALTLGGHAAATGSAEIDIDTVTEGAVVSHDNELRYSGRDNAAVDGDGQPVPPFIRTMEAA